MQQPNKVLLLVVEPSISGLSRFAGSSNSTPPPYKKLLNSVHWRYMKNACVTEGRGLDLNFISQVQAQRLLDDVAVTGAAYDVHAHARVRPRLSPRTSPSVRVPRTSSSGRMITQQFVSRSDADADADADADSVTPTPSRSRLVRQEHARKYDLHEQREHEELTKLQQYRRRELNIFDPEDKPITITFSL